MPRLSRISTLGGGKDSLRAGKRIQSGGAVSNRLHYSNSSEKFHVVVRAGKLSRYRLDAEPRQSHQKWLRGGFRKRTQRLAGCNQVRERNA
jgi:hypothetical protein